MAISADVAANRNTDAQATKRKFVGSGLYLLPVLLFLLPFASVSCGGHQVASLSGVDLGFGHNFGPTFGSIPELNVTNGSLPPNLWLLLLWVLPLAGVAIQWLAGNHDFRIPPAFATLVGLLGFVTMIGVLGYIQHVSLLAGQNPQYEGMVEVDVQAGLWLTLFAFVVLAGWGCLDLWLAAQARGIRNWRGLVKASSGFASPISAGPHTASARPGVRSPDGRFIWNGQVWLNVSDDGQFYWDGATWQHVSRLM